MTDTLLYLSHDAVTATGLGPAELICTVERAFAAQARGAVTIGPKGRVTIGVGQFFQTMLGTLDEPPLAGMKWFGVVPDNPVRGLPNVCSLIVLNDIATGLPLAVIDGTWVTAMRTAAMTAAAAKRLALPQAEIIAFVGCGTQARSHALLLRQVCPGLKRATLLGRGPASRDLLAAELRESGWQVRLARGPEDALADAQIVISSVPEYPGWTAFLDPARLEPGAFAGAVDLGRSWLPSGYPAFDIVATDDVEQSRALVAQGSLKSPADFDVDLATLVSGAHPGRRSAQERVLFAFAGNVLADLAVAAAVYQRAAAQGLGITLPR